MPKTSRKVWLTFPSRDEVETPVIWQMSQKFPAVVFDIRQASVQESIGIMAVLLSGEASDVAAAIAFLKGAGLQVEPIEKTVLEG
jgi:hypothetical protein